MKLEIWNKLSRSSSLILIFLLVIFCLIKVWSYGQATSGLDFHEKWEVGQSLIESAPKNIYAGQFLGYHISTPFLYTLFHIFPSGNYGPDLKIYRLLCLVSSVFAIVMLGRLLRYPAAAGMAAIVVFMDWFQPFLSDLRVANVNQLQLGLIALFLWLQSEHRLRGRNFLSGLVLGFAVMAKPNLAFVVLMLTVSWLINRRFGKFLPVYAGIAVAAVGAFIGSSAIFGSVRCWKDWLTVLPSVSDYRYVVDKANYSPSMLIFEWAGIKTSACLAIGCIVLATVFIWIGRRNAGKSPRDSECANDRERELFEDILMAAMGCLIYLLSATLVWLHYFLLTVPMALIALRPLRGDKPGFGAVARRVIAAAAIVIIAELPIRTFFSVTEPYKSALLLNIGTLTLFGLGLWELLVLRRGPYVQYGVGEKNEHF